MPGDGWQEEYKERVLAEFHRVHEDLEKLGKKIDNLKDLDITSMKLAIATMQQENKDSARTWGFLSGMAASIITSILVYVLISAFHIGK